MDPLSSNHNTVIAYNSHIKSITFRVFTKSSLNRYPSSNQFDDLKGVAFDIKRDYSCASLKGSYSTWAEYRDNLISRG